VLAGEQLQHSEAQKRVDKRTSQEERLASARPIQAAAGGKPLFLTCSLIGHSVGMDVARVSTDEPSFLSTKLG
jgi:hypothetical protein